MGPGGLLTDLTKRAATMATAAMGLTTGEIEAHLAEVYSTEISRETISKITDRVLRAR